MVPLLDLRASLLTILLGEDNVRYSSRCGRDEGRQCQGTTRGRAGLLRGHGVRGRKVGEGAGRVYIVIF